MSFVEHDDRWEVETVSGTFVLKKSESNGINTPYYVRRTGHLDLVFSGDMLAGEYCGAELWEIYRTQGGSLVGTKKVHLPDINIHEAFILEDGEHIRGIHEFFGLSDSAKRLYDRAGIPACEIIE